MNDTRFASVTPDLRAKFKRDYEKDCELVGRMRRAGVEILAGSDMSADLLIPGFSLQDELVLLVKAGLTPMEALQAATRNQARFLGLVDSLGTIERGKIAGLVLFDANPLLDIRHMQKINAVVVDGRFLDRTALDDLLAKVVAASQDK
jgi:imidazolonepropionase-like amidohydrolase